jgi:two-component system OmpR family response regulator
MQVKKILMVEDDPDIRRVAVMALKFKGGFEVLTASDGVEGLEVAAKEKPDVILLDSMMPKMDGPETCKRLKADETLRKIPVIFLTAKSQKKEIEAGLELGAIGYLVKPFDPMTLADELKKLVEPL